MKKIIIFSLTIILLIGVSFTLLNGQSKRSKSQKSISHSIDNDNENYVKTDENGTIKIERKYGKITRLNINGEEIAKADFSKYENMVEQIIEDIPIPPSPPTPPIPPTWGRVEQDFDALEAADNEEDFEAVLEAQMLERKAHLQEMYEEKSRVINEAIEMAQQRKKNN